MCADTPKRDGAKSWLESAYDLTTPQDNRAYYQDFASTYDAEFAQALGYCYPRIIAETYLDQAGPQDGPVADIGCGTGLVAEALPKPLVVDGFDISAKMLEKARAKKLYRALHEIDITGPLEQAPRGYGALVSAGTFTHGHLGPDPLRPLLTFVRDGGLFVIGVNQSHFEGHGFGGMLDQMATDGLISDLSLSETRIYDTGGHAHGDDLALVVTYRKYARQA